LEQDLAFKEDVPYLPGRAILSWGVLFVKRLAFVPLMILAACSKGSVNLTPPPEGQGFHFETEETAIPFGVEEQDCYFFQVPDNGEDVFVDKVEVAMNEGSHHMNIFRVRTIAGLDPANGELQTAQDGTGECFNSANWADWPLVINTQDDQDKVEWQLPDNVVHHFEPGEWLMLQTHYVNATTQKTPYKGHVEVNFWTREESDELIELGTVFATKQSIRICESNPTPTFEGSFSFVSDEPIHVIGANAHFHSRGKKFNMYSWDGTSTETPPTEDRFYQSTEWDHPPMARSPELDLEIPANGGVWYNCSYEWQEPPEDVGCDTLNDIDIAKGTAEEDVDCCYRFGGVVDKNEHCNVFVYYYPKVDDINIF
jgi:hypothetical protein